jgi:hypothetical protein
MHLGHCRTLYIVFFMGAVHRQEACMFVYVKKYGTPGLHPASHDHDMTFT